MERFLAATMGAVWVAVAQILVGWARATLAFASIVAVLTGEIAWSLLSGAAVTTVLAVAAYANEIKHRRRRLSVGTQPLDSATRAAWGVPEGLEVLVGGEFASIHPLVGRALIVVAGAYRDTKLQLFGFRHELGHADVRDRLLRAPEVLRAGLERWARISSSVDAVDGGEQGSIFYTLLGWVLAPTRDLARLACPSKVG